MFKSIFKSVHKAQATIEIIITLIAVTYFIFIKPLGDTVRFESVFSGASYVLVVGNLIRHYYIRMKKKPDEENTRNGVTN